MRGVRSWWGSRQGPILAALEPVLTALVCDLCGHRGLWFVCALQIATRAALGWGDTPWPCCSRRDRVTPTEPPLLPSLQWETGWKRGMFSKVSWLGRVGGSGQPRDSWVPQPSGPGESPVPLLGIVLVLCICACWYFKPCCFLGEKLQMELCGDCAGTWGVSQGAVGAWGVPVNQIPLRVLGAFLGSVSCSWGLVTWNISSCAVALCDCACAPS